MGKLSKDLMVATMPSLKGLIKLSPSSEHHSQSREHQDQRKQEHRACFHHDGKVQQCRMVRALDMGSLVTQGINRIEVRGFERREEAEDYSDHGAD